MPLPQNQIYTLDDIYALPDGSRAELVDGQIYDMAPPSTRHQDISMALSTLINNYISSTKGGCKVYAAPFAVFLNDDNTNYFEPDISIICDKSKIDDYGCHGAPDFIIEIVDPAKETITVYNYQKDDAPLLYRFTDTIKVHIYNDLYIDFSKLSEILTS